MIALIAQAALRGRLEEESKKMEEAEKLKAQGNQSLAEKKYSDAAQCYSSAVRLCHPRARECLYIAQCHISAVRSQHPHSKSACTIFNLTVIQDGPNFAPESSNPLWAADKGGDMRANAQNDRNSFCDQISQTTHTFCDRKLGWTPSVTV